jgi:hypothetical protein
MGCVGWTECLLDWATGIEYRCSSGGPGLRELSFDLPMFWSRAETHGAEYLAITVIRSKGHLTDDEPVR